LASGLAHDFNNLLTVITGCGEMLQEELVLGDQGLENVNLILQAGKGAAHLTQQLLAFSRGQVLQPRAVSLNTVLADLERMLCRLIGKDVELKVILGPELGLVKVDPGQMEQVIVNLAINARDAMPNGGLLTIGTGNVDFVEASAGMNSTVPAGAYVMLAVSDVGTGMDKETQARIFEPFFTTKGAGKGTGLGLSTVYGIIKQSGGDISVRSAPGGGTTLKIYLPKLRQPDTILRVDQSTS
jgi:two-component system cell cycle sensor histidine kinase/response regulator CckA